MVLKAGTRLFAQNSSCEVVVIRGSEEDTALLCGGAEMRPDGHAGEAVEAGDAPTIALGKRYTDVESGVEVLCTKPGFGPLAYGDRPLSLKSAKPLPASD